jgi:hypothetical protein
MPPHEKKEGLTIFLAGNWQPAQIGGVYITPLCERQTGFSIFFFRLILDPIPGDGLFPALAPPRTIWLVTNYRTGAAMAGSRYRSGRGERFPRKLAPYRMASELVAAA